MTNEYLIIFQTNVKVETKDGKDTTLTFRKILLNKCQKEFEKEKSDEISIHEKMDELLKQGLSVSIYTFFVLFRALEVNLAVIGQFKSAPETWHVALVVTQHFEYAACNF